MKKIIRVSLLLLLFMSLGACSSKSKIYEKEQWLDYSNLLYEDTTVGKNFVGIDLRELDVYKEGHITGFKEFPFASKRYDEFLDWVSGLYSKKTTIYLLDEEDGVVEIAYKILVDDGFKNVYGYSGGYDYFMLNAKDSFLIATGTTDCSC